MTITERTIKLYTFDELTDAAQERARDWWREASSSDTAEFEDVIEDAKEIAKLFGYDIEDIYWSGFAHQGQGACAEGSYTYRKGALKDVKAYAPQDTELHAIVQRLQDVQRRYFYHLYAKTKQAGHYHHCEVDTWHDHPVWGHVDCSIHSHDQLATALQDFSSWVYDRLDAQNDYTNTDEYIDDTLESNEYTFTVDGERED